MHNAEPATACIPLKRWWLAACMQEAAARQTAALVLAKVAAIELPNQQWPDLVKLLLANMSVTPPDTGLRQSTLQTLGYICEEMAAIHDDVLSQEEINAVLTAVVQASCALAQA